jgi:hypothetical protein
MKRLSFSTTGAACSKTHLLQIFEPMFNTVVFVDKLDGKKGKNLNSQSACKARVNRNN